ncbi:hypothetical protein T05_5447 [Trichinella murrelli]|uniref:Uncharacterized protein n=1 Tax=Trichinella murrelli TaxID=144512 RepID=A0A0V0STF9_9BILA|nr:hypothetical protein T05_5447 [Trichinella murrelli]
MNKDLECLRDLRGPDSLRLLVLLQGRPPPQLLANSTLP